VFDEPLDVVIAVGRPVAVAVPAGVDRIGQPARARKHRTRVAPRVPRLASAVQKQGRATSLPVRVCLRLPHIRSELDARALEPDRHYCTVRAPVRISNALWDAPLSCVDSSRTASSTAVCRRASICPLIQRSTKTDTLARNTHGSKGLVR